MEHVSADGSKTRFSRGLVALALVSIAACSPIAPSLEKALFNVPGLPGGPGAPLAGNTYRTQLAADPGPSPSDGSLTLTTSALAIFKASRQVTLQLGQLPPGEVRGVFVVSLHSQDVAALADFRTELVPTQNGNWILRVLPEVNSTVSQIVLNNLEEVRIEFAVGVSGSSVISGETEEEDAETPVDSGGTEEPVADPATESADSQP